MNKSYGVQPKARQQASKANQRVGFFICAIV